MGSQIGAITGKHANLRATIPVSDMIEFISSVLKLQYRGAVAAGDCDEELTAEQEEKLKHQEEQQTILRLRRIDSPNEILMSHINPEITADNAEFAEYFIVIHRDLLINKDKLNDILEINFSPGHTYIEFVTKKQILEKSFFGKHPAEDASNPIIAKGEIRDEKVRYENSKEYDKRYNTNFLDSRIIPLTKEQFEAAYEYANQVKKNPNTYLIMGFNCNNFVQEVFAKTKIPGTFTQIYTTKELKEMNNLGASDALRNFGSCNKYFETYAVDIQEVMSKYNITADRIIELPETYDGIPMPKIYRFIVTPSNNCLKTETIDELLNKK